MDTLHLERRLSGRRAGLDRRRGIDRRLHVDLLDAPASVYEGPERRVNGGRRGQVQRRAWFDRRTGRAWIEATGALPAR